MTKLEIESSIDLINNLLLNLDNLRVQNETNKYQENVNLSLQDQLDILKYEAQRLTNQYTQSDIKNNKSKKIPPPIITGKKRNCQTIDDLLFELNNVSVKAYGNNQTPSSKSSRGKKSQGSFVDPRRYSDPYKYTILSTLDESEDGEEEESIYTLKTPSTAIPYYSRKKNNNLKVPGVCLTPKSAGVVVRNRSYSQPESCTYNRSPLSDNIPLKLNMEQNDRTSTKYLMKIHNSINTEKKTNTDFYKPPRSSSISKHTFIPEGYNSSDSSDSEYKMDKNIYVTRRGKMGLGSKPSFQSDRTLVNEE